MRHTDEADRHRHTIQLGYDCGNLFACHTTATCCSLTCTVILCDPVYDSLLWWCKGITFWQDDPYSFFYSRRLDFTIGRIFIFLRTADFSPGSVVGCYLSLLVVCGYCTYVIVVVIVMTHAPTSESLSVFLRVQMLDFVAFVSQFDAVCTISFLSAVWMRCTDHVLVHHSTLLGCVSSCMLFCVGVYWVIFTWCLLLCFQTLQRKHDEEIKALSRKLKWYVENQELLDKNANIIKLRDSEIHRLRIRVEDLRTEVGFSILWTCPLSVGFSPSCERAPFLSVSLHPMNVPPFCWFLSILRTCPLSVGFSPSCERAPFLSVSLHPMNVPPFCWFLSILWTCPLSVGFSPSYECAPFLLVSLHPMNVPTFCQFLSILWTCPLSVGFSPSYERAPFRSVSLHPMNVPPLCQFVSILRMCPLSVVCIICRRVLPAN